MRVVATSVRERKYQEETNNRLLLKSISKEKELSAQYEILDFDVVGLKKFLSSMSILPPLVRIMKFKLNLIGAPNLLTRHEYLT